MTTSPTRFGDVCELINGGAWKQTEYVNNGIPVVQVSNMKNGTIDVSDLKFLPPNSYDRYKKHTLMKFDLVIATVGSHATQASAAGRATIVKGFAAGMLLNQNAVAIRSKSESLDQGYLGLIGRSDKFQFYLGTVGQGAANQVRIALSAIKEYKCDLPPIVVQRRIAEVISAYDDLIENNRRRIQLLKQAARLLYREWFVNLRFPGHAHVKIKDGVPEGWEKKPMGDFIRFANGKAMKSGQEGKYPVYGSNGIIGRSEEYLHENGIIIGRVGAYCGSIEICRGRFGASDNTIVATMLGKPIETPYLFHMLKHIDLNRFAGGAAQPLLTQSNLKGLPVLVPTLTLRLEFNQFAGEIFAQRDCLVESNSQLNNARDLILPRLMNGEVAV